jgi:RNA polymerase sigma-70 factor (ECF subfamily)
VLRKKVAEQTGRRVDAERWPGCRNQEYLHAQTYTPLGISPSTRLACGLARSTRWVNGQDSARVTYSARRHGARLSDIRQLDDAVAPLVARAQGGDAAARDELLRACHATVYRWALVQTGDPDDADDVAQDVLMRLYTRLDRYAGRSRFTTWLYQVTRNASRGWGRRIGSRLRLATRAAHGARVAPLAPNDPVERAHTAQVGEIVMRLFTELPARQREVFHLADLEGFTPAEIAERLRMNPVTVRAHLFRARRALRARILERHPELAEDRGS